MNQDDTSTFREYEKFIDNYHMSLPFWKLPRDQSLFLLLSLSDLVTMGILPPEVINNDSKYDDQAYKQIEEGISLAIRWITSEGNIGISSCCERKYLSHAIEFCVHASKYAVVADMHSLYGYKWIDVDVNQQVNTVVFRSIESHGRNEAIVWHEQVEMQARYAMKKASRLKGCDLSTIRSTIRQIEFQTNNGFLELGEFPPDLVSRLSPIIKLVCDYELIPIPRETDLGGFTMLQLEGFFAAMLGWSYVAMGCYENLVRDNPEMRLFAPIQVVDIGTFVNKMMRISCLSEEIIHAILGRLEYKNSRKADILLTPLIRTRDSICWSPSVISKYRLERNVMKVMSRGDSGLQRCAATVNGSRSRPLSRMVGEHFSKHGYQFKLDTKISDCGDETDVDVLLYSTQRGDEVLVVEVKSFLAPDEISEVHSAAVQLKYAQGQICRAIKIINSTDIRSKSEIFKFVQWDKVKHIYGVVVTNDADAHSTVDQNTCPVITYRSMIQRCTGRHMRSPSRFWEACRCRPWEKSEVAGIEDGCRDIVIGHLTYRIPTTWMSVNS